MSDRQLFVGDRKVDIEEIICLSNFLYIKHIHNLKKGDRVRPSDYGIYRYIFTKTRFEMSGVVTKTELCSVTVKWDGYKTTHSYYSGFVKKDRRRKKSC